MCISVFVLGCVCVLCLYVHLAADLETYLFPGKEKSEQVRNLQLMSSQLQKADQKDLGSEIEIKAALWGW